MWVENTTGAVTQPTTKPSDPPFDKTKGAEFTANDKRNVLNKYRLWTYNFTMGAIAVSDMAEPEKSIDKHIVLKTAGKGNTPLTLNPQVTDKLDKGKVQAFLNTYNTNSAGRFDMFIDQVEIESIIAAGKNKIGMSQATGIKFTVTEPYSMNGFIEAMQAAALSAGYTTYSQAVFALRFTFMGYPDETSDAVSLPPPRQIEDSDRLFLVTITEVGVKVSEAGTVYNISAVPTNQLGFGTTNTLVADIQIAGNTVREVLQNFFKAINESIEKVIKESKEEVSASIKDRLGDTYSFACSQLVTPTSPQKVENSYVYNGLANANSFPAYNETYQHEMVAPGTLMNDSLSSVNVFKLKDLSNNLPPNAGTNVKTANKKPLSSAKTETDKTIPFGANVAFKQGAQIHDCVTAIIRDSKYVTDILKDAQTNGPKVKDDMYEYFTVRIETDIREYDYTANRLIKHYIYVLEPYQMHVSTIPENKNKSYNMTLLKQKLQRTYDYIYTGKNLDIIKFDLNFDNLYFSALPVALGSASADFNLNKAGIAPGDSCRKETASVQTGVANATEANKSHGSNQAAVINAPAGQRQSDPYYKMAHALHNAILNGVDKITGTLDIYGDPYYLVTGATKNKDLKTISPYLTAEGEAPVTQGALYININFRNPIDIDSNTGFMKFDNELVSFSGIYQVIGVKSSFKNGEFMQTLDIIRTKGQIVPGVTSAKTIGGKIKDSIDPNAKSAKDSSKPTLTFTPLAGLNNFVAGALTGLSKAAGTISSDLESSLSGPLANIRGDMAKAIDSGNSAVTTLVSKGEGLVTGALSSIGGAAARLGPVPSVPSLKLPTIPSLPSPASALNAASNITNQFPQASASLNNAASQFASNARLAASGLINSNNSGEA